MWRLAWTLHRLCEGGAAALSGGSRRPELPKTGPYTVDPSNGTQNGPEPVVDSVATVIGPTSGS